jgi:hypothetical protein
MSDNRTVAQVMAEREQAVMGWCCDRFADYMACSCLEDARRREKARDCVALLRAARLINERAGRARSDEARRELREVARILGRLSEEAKS